MNVDQVLEAIDNALAQYKGDELALMQRLSTLGTGWIMREAELEDEQE